MFGNEGFKDGNKTGNDYVYDANGNMISDANKRITSVEYNHLNMPTKITVTGSNVGTVNYVYAADRTKLRKINSDGTTTDYAGSFVYENNTLKQFNQPEGYVEPKGSSYEYVYRYTDIWGNTRLTYADTDGNGTIAQGEIRREQNYYPFGLEHKGYNNVLNGAKNNLKTYQKQEFTEDLGLNTHEWKYRISDPTTGRFWQIDPLAADYTYNSTYAFQENKMGMGVELEGLELGNFPIDTSGIERGFENLINSVTPETSETTDNVLKGTGNIIMGTIGTIGSVLYLAGTEGIGAPLGGGAALTLSIAEISIGVSQIADAISNDSQNTVLQSSSSIPGLIANEAGSEHAELIDAAGQFIPGLLSGGNLKTIIQEGGNVLAGKGTLLGTAGAVDATMDTKGVIDAATNSTSTSVPNKDEPFIGPILPE